MNDYPDTTEDYCDKLQEDCPRIAALRVELAAARAAIRRAVEQLADIELEQEIDAAQHVRIELGAALGGGDE